MVCFAELRVKKRKKGQHPGLLKRNSVLITSCSRQKFKVISQLDKHGPYPLPSVEAHNRTELFVHITLKIVYSNPTRYLPLALINIFLK